jgi:hypothetical protein
MKQLARRPKKIDPAVYLPQQQRAAVARYPVGCELCLHPAQKMRCKLEHFLITLCQ